MHEVHRGVHGIAVSGTSPPHPRRKTLVAPSSKDETPQKEEQAKKKEKRKGPPLRPFSL